MTSIGFVMSFSGETGPPETARPAVSLYRLYEGLGLVPAEQHALLLSVTFTHARGSAANFVRL